MNKLFCVTDKCSHRGASLGLGEVKGDCVMCPFHGILFDGLGKCTLIPADGISSKLDNSRFNIDSYLVQEENGIIYFWYGDKNLATKELPFFDELLDSKFIYSEIKDNWNSHYSRCIENQLDVVHLPFIHKTTIGRGNKTLVNGPKLIIEGTMLTLSANNEFDNGQSPKKAEECIIKPTYLKFKYPNVWLNNISNKIKAFIYFAPVDDENTVLYIRFYCKATPIKKINKFIAFTGKFANKIIENQDKRVVITQIPKASSLRCDENLISGRYANNRI